MLELKLDLDALGIDYSNYERIDIDDVSLIKSDNLFMAIIDSHSLSLSNVELLKEAYNKIRKKIKTHIVSAINNQIYDFTDKRFLTEEDEIINAKPFSEVYNDNQWRFGHIIDYDFIVVDVDDNVYFKMDMFSDMYSDIYDKKAKDKILESGIKSVWQTRNINR